MSKYMSLEQTIRKLGAKGVSQPLEKDMNDQVHAGSYSSKHFEVSAPAQKLYASLPKEVNPDDAEKSVQLHDKLFAIHKKTSASERSTDADVKDAQRLHDEIMKIAKDMGLEDKHGHVKDSLEHIKKYLDTQVDHKDEITPEDVAKRFATPPKDYQTDVKADADIDNIAKFKITRDKKGQRKLKIIDDEYNLGATKMDRIEKVSPSFLEALKQVQENEKDLVEKKKMTKADIAALKEPKGSIDAKDLAALRAGEHKKKVEEGMLKDIAKDTLKNVASQTLSKYGALGKAAAKAVENKMKKEETELEEAKATHNYTPKGVECPVCGMEACPPKPSTNEEVALQTFAEAVRSIARASRTWADKKTSTDIAKKHSKKGYTPPGTPSKAEMRAKGAEALKAFLAKGGKIRKEEVENLDEVTASINHKYVPEKWGEKSGKVKRILDSLEKAKIPHSVAHFGGDRNSGITYVTSDHPKFAGHMEKLAKKADTYDPKIQLHGVNEEVEALDEAQFIVIQKGMNQKRIRNNPAEIMQARKDGWAIREEVELDEGIDKAQVERKLRSKYMGGNPKVTFHKGVVKVNAAGKDYHHKITKGQVEDRPFMTVDEEYISEAKSKKPSPSTDNADMAKIRKIAGPGKIMHKEPWHPSHAGHNLYTHTDHNSNTPKIRAFKVHQKTGKVTEFKNYKPSFGEEVETVDEANELKSLAKSQAAATVKREVGQKKALFAKKDAVDKQKFSKSMQSIKAGDEVEVDGERLEESVKAAQESFMERAIAILGEEFANASYEELAEEIVKRGRGRPRKNPPPDANAPKRGRGRPRKDAAPVASSSAKKPEDTDKDREHIVMGLRKAVSLRGEHGVKFADGSVHKIPAEHAQKALKMHDSLSKPSEKMTFARKLAASHDSFKRALSDKNPGSEETKKTGITLAKRAD